MAVPVEIKRANVHDVAIDWDDGHASVYVARELRLACPCANCVDEMTGRKRLDDTDVPADVHPLGISPVGRYAIHFQWSDGHTSGIYTFEHLRRVCPCAECANSSQTH